MNDRLALDRSNAMIFGLCAGIGHATGLAPRAVRLLTIAASLLVGPLVLILYLIVALILADR